MNDIFKNELKEYIKQNFNYAPEFRKKSKEITRYVKEKKGFDSLHFPKNDEISNLFIYNSLKILNDIKPEKTMRNYLNYYLVHIYFLKMILILK